MDATEKSLRRSRDPEVWRVLSDLLLDRGEVEEAAHWRRMGDWGRVLLPLWLQLAYFQQPLTRIAELGGGVTARHQRKRSTIRITMIKGGVKNRNLIVITNHVLCLYGLGQTIRTGADPEDEVVIDYDRPPYARWRYLRSRLRAVCEFGKEFP